MQYIHDKAQAKEYATEALARMDKEKIPPTPDNFELWYVYYSGQSKDVRRAIDILEKNGQALTNERCKELYQRFLSESRDEERIRQAGEKVNTTLNTVSDTVKDVKSATSKYSGRLGGVTDKISNVKDAGELKKILTDVVSDTHEMIEQNQKLEEELDKSSKIMQDLQRDLEKVRKEALTDGLTGLANRKALDMELKRVAEQAYETGTTFSLMMLDIDHFKSFNDNFGHQVGDQVLRLVAKTLTDGIKGRDMAARYGGEEFMIVLPDTPLDSGVTVANALRRAVATKDVINRNTGEKLGRITLSAGVAEFTAEESITELVERADAALYTAKHNGRNQVAAAPTPGKKKKKSKKN